MRPVSARGIELLSIPYDSARRGWRMGAGPQALLRAGLVQQLRRAGDVELVPIEGAQTDDPLASAFDLAARTARVVHAASSGGRLPVVLTGNCIGTVGAIAGVNADALVWLDAHADLNTPETSTSGFLDGMSAAVCIGWCHGERSGAIDGFRALPENALILVGTRDIDPPEQQALERSAVKLIAPDAVSANAAAVGAVIHGARTVWLHVDLDVLDPERVGRANPYATAGGLTTSTVIDALRSAASGRTVVGLTISAYDPAGDTSGAIARAAIEIITAVTEAS